MYLTIYPNGNIYTTTFLKALPKNLEIKPVASVTNNLQKREFALLTDKKGLKTNKIASQLANCLVKGNATVCLGGFDLKGLYCFYPMKDETVRYFLKSVLEEELITDLRSNAIIIDKLLSRQKMTDKV